MEIDETCPLDATILHLSVSQQLISQLTALFSPLKPISSLHVSLLHFFWR